MGVTGVVGLIFGLAVWAVIIYLLVKGIRHLWRRWPHMDTQGRRKTIITAVVGVLIIGGLAAWRPWESQNYKDCINAYEDSVDGSPGNRRADLERYCRESADGDFRR